MPDMLAMLCMSGKLDICIALDMGFGICKGACMAVGEGKDRGMPCEVE
jgi:hypothetical protein